MPRTIAESEMVHLSRPFLELAEFMAEGSIAVFFGPCGAVDTGDMLLSLEDRALQAALKRMPTASPLALKSLLPYLTASWEPKLGRLHLFIPACMADPNLDLVATYAQDLRQVRSVAIDMAGEIKYSLDLPRGFFDSLCSLVMQVLKAQDIPREIAFRCLGLAQIVSRKPDSDGVVRHIEVFVPALSA